MTAIPAFIDIGPALIAFLVEVNYQITSTKNAMSAGPLSISAGVAVTVPSGCSWTIV